MSDGEIGRAAVISLDVRLNGDTMGATRYPYIAQRLHRGGFKVDLITSTFQHWQKTQRDIVTFKPGTDAYNVVFLQESGYAKNIDLRRLISHREAVRSFRSFADAAFDYDVVYCQIPPNNLALAAAEVCHRRGIPFIVDVNDLWPEAMRMSFDVPVISDIAYAGFWHDARRTYRLASAVVGTSEEYADRPFADRPRDIPRLVVYVGCDMAAFDAGAALHADAVDKPSAQFWVTYAGTVGTSYDLKTLVLAAARLKNDYPDIFVKILGDGPQRAEVEELARSVDCNVDFLGHRDYGEMAAFLVRSDVVVNSLVKGAPQSIPAKIGDYLASGRPMINTSESPEFCAKVEHDGFGVNVHPGDVDDLAANIAALHDSPVPCMRMGANARNIGASQFDRETAYGRIVDLARASVLPAQTLDRPGQPG